MLYYETIKPETLDLLRRIQKLGVYENTRLVGGTALALQIGHRVSVDLDFFGVIQEESYDILQSLHTVSDVKLLSTSKDINVFLADGVKVDSVNYPYEWIDGVIEENGLRLASIKEIAAMKISAICNRGTKKDFVDLHFLLKRYSIRELLNFYMQKYPDGSEFIVIKSLTYFEDAEEDPMPFMLIPVEWKEIKKTITKVVEEEFKSRI